ncbi:acetyltransferase [Desulfosarcina ovata subsp. sediminis]|uniref:Acetyltransferase n=1 Tax=Desulfosarcina ovata subsp. sediminis TaxID=885957 RepID=A0A5K7ZRE0_9BACT|nr:acyltransferase [Desulfosarcina ovata]BBO81293.1 acetyltransferase [Desulfosarcina ovata subsp. sediminis]
MPKLFNIGYYDENELRNEGFKFIGKNVKIAKNCTIVGCENISIGNNVRIDAYTTITAIGNGFVNIGSYVHIGTCVLLIGGSGIIIEDFCNISHGTKIYSKADDLSGEYLVNPLVPEKYTNVVSGCVTLKRYCMVATLCVILPNVTIQEGTVLGALSLLTRSLPEWSIFVGNPARKIRKRSKKLIELEKELLKDNTK